MCSGYLYADDMKIFTKVIDNNSKLLLQQDIDKVAEWSDRWMLKLNPSKCKSITIGNPKFKIPGTYTLNTEHGTHTLEDVTTEKDLGVLIDSELNFENHIYSKIKTANKMLAIIKRNFQNLDSDSFLMLYKALVRSHLEYAEVIWNPYKIKHITASEQVQKRATKLVSQVKNLPYKDRLIKLGLPTLVYRRSRGDMIELFKIVSDIYDKNTVPDLRPAISSITRSHNKELFKPFSNRMCVRNFSLFVQLKSGILSHTKL